MGLPLWGSDKLVLFHLFHSSILPSIPPSLRLTPSLHLSPSCYHFSFQKVKRAQFRCRCQLVSVAALTYQRCCAGRKLLIISTANIKQLCICKPQGVGGVRGTGGD